MTVILLTAEDGQQNLKVSIVANNIELVNRINREYSKNNTSVFYIEIINDISQYDNGYNDNNVLKIYQEFLTEGFNVPIINEDTQVYRKFTLGSDEREETEYYSVARIFPTDRIILKNIMEMMNFRPIFSNR